MDKTCLTCAYRSRKTKTVTSGKFFWIKTQETEKNYCSRFGLQPIPVDDARGYFAWHDGTKVYHEGPCGIEGKFWEPEIIGE